MVPKCPSQGLTKFHIKASSSAKADDPVPRGASIDRWPGVYWIPRWSLSSGSPKGETRRRGVTVVPPPAPACFPVLLAPNRGREIGGGRATRQPGQVRKEAALTRSGSGRSSVSYPFFRANRAESGDLCLERPRP